ncbi:YkgJ family cysteine cluster protein [Archaeoglobus veneficus]|uniref:YkgJ family cysteine cluster protein n=1 Tax=Archaeoglobus veneficus (strain DSM 11195 / SNP6) TaxID=693661 RepID=F2KQB0_ARCVS|nr:YkgJ family cysteine cluster protein [Archaeoglobus veneficus]AEA46543.1 protein of unknown function UPF0153 [Archaeoglobus veneficus SNP6]
MNFEPDTALFARVNLGDSFANVPLVCRKCGMCCEKLSHVIYDPLNGEIIVENIEEIKEFLGIRYHEVLEELESQIKGVNAVMVNPCPFLQDGRCTVYPARPASCRPFPLFGDQGIGCPALKRFEELLKALGCKEAERTCIPLGRVKKGKPDRNFVEKFLNVADSEEIELFLALNHVEVENFQGIRNSKE